MIQIVMWYSLPTKVFLIVQFPMYFNIGYFLPHYPPPPHHHGLLNRPVFFFLEHFKVHSKIERNLQRFPIYPLPHSCIASPTTFISIDRPAMTHPDHPRSRVCIRVHSGWWTFYGFWQMCSPLQYHTKWFQYLKNPLCSTCSSLPLPNSCNHWSFTVSIVLPFPYYF